MQDHDKSRRTVIRTLSLGAATLLAAGRMPIAIAETAAKPAPKPAAAPNAAAAAAPKPALPPLSPDDPTAKSLGYVEDSSKVVAASNPTHKPEQKCTNCAQYNGKPGDARGGCNIYAGKSVNANGWCRVYAAKKA